MSNFASVTDTTRYEFPQFGLWVEFRNELSVAEDRAIAAECVKGQRRDGAKLFVEYDTAKYAMRQMRAYLAAWSESLPISDDTIGGLKPRVFDALEQQLGTHIEAMAGKTEATTTTQMPAVAAI